MIFQYATVRFGRSLLYRLGSLAAPALLISTIGLVSPVTAAVDLVPHQAIYRMKLATATRGSGIADAEGVMAYSFRDGCDSWTSETKVKLRLVYAEGHDVDTSWSFASWEAKDGLAYSFNIQHRRDGEVTEVLKGKVDRSAPGGAGEARFSVPEGKVILLPAGTLFPTRHLLDLIAAGERGEPVFQRTVFDGASVDNPYNINAVIARAGLSGRAKTAAARGRAAADLNLAKILSAGGLAAAPVRHMRMAFFPLDSRAAEPDFELGVDYRPDGVASRIRQDFGDFSIDLVPDEIKTLKRPSC